MQLLVCSSRRARSGPPSRPGAACLCGSCHGRSTPPPRGTARGDGDVHVWHYKLRTTNVAWYASMVCSVCVRALVCTRVATQRPKTAVAYDTIRRAHLRAYRRRVRRRVHSREAVRHKEVDLPCTQLLSWHSVAQLASHLLHTHSNTPKPEGHTSPNLNQPAKLSGAGDPNPVRQTQQQPGNAVNTTTRANAVTKKRTRQQHSVRLPRAGSPPTHESVPVPAHATARTTPLRTRAAISTTTSSTAATAQQ